MLFKLQKYHEKIVAVMIFIWDVELILDCWPGSVLTGGMGVSFGKIMINHIAT